MKAKVIMLEIDSISSLQMTMSNNLHLENGSTVALQSYQNIYLIDEFAEIKEGDVMLEAISDNIYTCHGFKNGIYLNKYGTGSAYMTKVIASTDKSLNLPQLSEQSIELLVDHYNKNGKMHDEVEIEESRYFINGKNCETCYSFINFKCRDAHGMISCKGLKEFNYWKPKHYLDIPKTIKSNSEGTIDITILEERMYSKEEVTYKIRKFFVEAQDIWEEEDVDKWIGKNL